MIFIIHPITVIYLFLGLMSDSLHGLIFLYLFGFIHEISHVLVARIFKIKTTEIALYPTGFRAKIGDFSHLSSARQLAILSAGPLSFFFSAALIVLFYRWGIVSVYGKRLCDNYNLLILLFNILPVYPLDGGKIFFLVINALCMLVIRKRIPQKFESYVHIAGFALLMLLMLAVTFQDVWKIFQ